MVEPLTSEWMRQLGSVTSAIKADPDVSLVIEQTVDGPTPLRWHVAISNGSASTVLGPADDPDITLTTDRETATGIATGSTSAQRAFLEGKLRISGRINSLIQARSVLEDISDALWSVRASDDFVDRHRSPEA